MTHVGDAGTALLGPDALGQDLASLGPPTPQCITRTPTPPPYTLPLPVPLTLPPTLTLTLLLGAFTPESMGSYNSTVTQLLRPEVTSFPISPAEDTPGTVAAVPVLDELSGGISGVGIISMQPVLKIDKDCKVGFCGKHAEGILGPVSLDQPLGSIGCITASDQAALEQAVLTVLKGSSPISAPIVVHSPTGDHTPTTLAAVSITDPTTGSITGVSVICADPLWTVDKDSRVDDASPEATLILGPDALGYTIDTLACLTPDSLEEYHTSLSRVKTHSAPISDPFKLKRREPSDGGAKRNVEARPVTLPSGVIGITIVEADPLFTVDLDNVVTDCGADSEPLLGAASLGHPVDTLGAFSPDSLAAFKAAVAEVINGAPGPSTPFLLAPEEQLLNGTAEPWLPRNVVAEPVLDTLTGALVGIQVVLADPLWAIDQDGKVTQCSENGALILGPDALGQSLNTLGVLTPNGLEAYTTAIAKVRNPATKLGPVRCEPIFHPTTGEVTGASIHPANGLFTILPDGKISKCSTRGSQILGPDALGFHLPELISITPDSLELLKTNFDVALGGDVSPVFALRNANGHEYHLRASPLLDPATGSVMAVTVMAGPPNLPDSHTGQVPTEAVWTIVS